MRAITDTDGGRYPIHRTVSLRPRGDGRDWRPGDAIALRDGAWLEAEGGETVTADVTEILP